MTRTDRPRSKRRRPGPKGGSGRASGGPPPEELKPIADPPPIESFDEWPLDPQVLRAIRGMDITTPTPVQKLAIGPVLEGRDVIAKAETGTGKTLAFGAPMVSKLDSTRSTILGLVLCPTRELAQQVEQVLKALGLPKGLKTALLVGGDPIPPQVKQLQQGAQLVVATPGRVLDLVGQRFLKFPWTEFAVLDEADEMLEIGFLDDVNKILDLLPEERQTLLFSATFPPALLQLARSHTKEPVEIATAKGVATVDRITQHVCHLGDDDKPHVLKRLLRESSEDDLFLVFCDRRTEVDRVFRFLERSPVPVKALHGGYDQAARFRVMSAFRSGGVRALVATDVASRGLDVSGVTHVINFSPPRDVSDYTHRIGRTGRAGATGHALTFVGRGDNRKWRELVGRMAWDVPEVDERDLRRVVLSPPATADEADGPGEERPRGRRREAEGDDRPRRRERGDDDRPRRRRRDAEDGEGERPRSRRRDRETDEERPRARRRRDADEAPRSTDSDEPPARRRRDAEDDRPRGRRRDEQEERPRARRRERDADEQPSSRRRDDEGDRARRPRRADRDGDETPARGRRRDGDDDRPRRPRRDEEGSDERPRRGARRRSDDRGPRDERSREDRGPRRGREAEDPARADRAGGSASGGGFGAGLEPEPRPAPRKARPTPARRRERPAQPDPAPPEAASDDGGFGAGLSD